MRGQNRHHHGARHGGGGSPAAGQRGRFVRNRARKRQMHRGRVRASGTESAACGLCRRHRGQQCHYGGYPEICCRMHWSKAFRRGHRGHGVGGSSRTCAKAPVHSPLFLLQEVQRRAVPGGGLCAGRSGVRNGGGLCFHIGRDQSLSEKRVPGTGHRRAGNIGRPVRRRNDIWGSPGGRSPRKGAPSRLHRPLQPHPGKCPGDFRLL